MNTTPIRVVLGKVGLDMHDIGSKVVARGLREAGMEVIYLGPFQTADSVVGAATTEDADVVAVSNISGEYATYVPEIVSKLRDRDLHPIVIVGGLVPDKDRQGLIDLGVDGVFGQGSTIDSIVEFIRGAVAKRSAARKA
jgi:methylmalonyl-CoA mutase, C-terminal domain